MQKERAIAVQDSQDVGRIDFDFYLFHVFSTPSEPKDHVTAN